MSVETASVEARRDELVGRLFGATLGALDLRSEERRVGKECRL